MGSRAGRKRKQGARTKSGRLSRAGVIPLANAPSEWVAEQKAKFGTHYSSALGRAYAAGLLGEGNEAKERLDAGNRFVTRYTRVFGANAYVCPLDRTPRGSNDNGLDDPDRMERDMRNQDWVFAITDKLDAKGLRPWLDQLIHRNYTDRGPHWLDALLVARWNTHGGHWRIGEPIGQVSDLRLLEAALLALDALGDET